MRVLYGKDQHTLKIESRDTKESAIVSRICTQCSVASGIFISNENRLVTVSHLLESLPGCSGHGFRVGTLKSKPRLTEESQSREPTVPCKWHPSVSWKTQSYLMSWKFAYTLGFLKRASGCDIRWKLLYLLSWKCSIFQSGLCSSIKITDFFLPPTAFPHSNTGFWKKKKMRVS